MVNARIGMVNTQIGDREQTILTRTRAGKQVLLLKALQNGYWALFINFLGNKHTWSPPCSAAYAIQCTNIRIDGPSLREPQGSPSHAGLAPLPPPAAPPPSYPHVSALGCSVVRFS